MKIRTMKSYIIVNDFYKKIQEINENTFIGLVELVKGEKEALKKARKVFNLAKDKNLVAVECQSEYIK
jgi:hypothetical protein